ncbi:MAG: RtcB family protein [Actinomycetota bacterium]|nr:RtcB family protein [Actinomycetota bacterium]
MIDGQIKKINDYKFEIVLDKGKGMNVPGIIFSNDKLIEAVLQEETINQVINVASLPGIVKASYAMPDIHYGYGFPIGGVAAFDLQQGVISPGGVGFDIACGVRVIKTDFEYGDIKNKIQMLMENIFMNVPKGVGTKGRLRLSDREMHDVLLKGALWTVNNNCGLEENLAHIEENGTFLEADPAHVSKEALQRGREQLGSLGSGNHFIELQKVCEIFDKEAAGIMDIFENQVLIMVHSGSRGLGHQVCSDYLKIMQNASLKYNINLKDRQLACAPFNSAEGMKYYKAMGCAVNFAMANRECLSYWIIQEFEKMFSKSYKKMGMELIYDISHNVAKVENHIVDNKKMNLCVHRKGATRSFGPGHESIPADYKKIGQPVIIPGDMGRYSYIMTGTKKAMTESMGSSCHGAGRLLSRTSAKRQINGSELKKELFREKGIIVLANSMSGLAEEAPQAYKDIADIVDIAENAGLSKKVAKLKPLGVIKG